MEVWCVYVFILCLCCPVCRYRPCDGLITRSRSPTVCEKWLRNWIRGQGREWAGRVIEKTTHSNYKMKVSTVPESCSLFKSLASLLDAPLWVIFQQYPDSITFNGRIIDERWIGKGFGRKLSDLTEVLSGETEKTTNISVQISCVPTDIRKEHPCNKSLHRSTTPTCSVHSEVDEGKQTCPEGWLEIPANYN
jgi:hypothetical protein